MKKALLFQLSILLLFSCNNSPKLKDNEAPKELTNANNLEINNIIDIQKAKLLVTGISIANETPINKVKPKTQTNHFILINLKIKEIEKDTQLSTVQFILKDIGNKEYEKPGSWGKIDFGGNISNFEASEGATSFLSKVDEEINLFFEVPINVIPKNTVLLYHWK